MFDKIAQFLSNSTCIAFLGYKDLTTDHFGKRPLLIRGYQTRDGHQCPGSVCLVISDRLK